MKSETFAVDFDGTLCRSAWPGIGEPIHEMINWIKELRQMGHKVILWTCREGMSLVNADGFEGYVKCDLPISYRGKLAMHIDKL